MPRESSIPFGPVGREVSSRHYCQEQWNAEKRNVQVDDFVIMQTQSTVRGNWNVGRVVSVYPGQDGKVRNVQVKTRTGEYERPITKISVIYPAEGYRDDK